jgi:hypothetical protein
MNFDITKFAAIVAAAKTAAANSPRRIRAIEKAAAALLNGELIITTLSAGHALVTSANGSYWVNGACQCAAAKAGHRECYHRAAARLVEMCEEAPAVDTKPATREEIEAAISSTYAEKFPTDNLSDALMTRFGCNSFRYMPIGLMQDILAAIR